MQQSGETVVKVEIAIRGFGRQKTASQKQKDFCAGLIAPMFCVIIHAMGNNKNPNGTLSVALPAILACLLWAGSFVFVKIGLKYMTPLIFAGMRFMLAGLLLIPFCGNPVRFMVNIFRDFKTICLIGFFQTFLLYGLFFIGMTLVRGAQAAIIIGASPLIAAVLAHYMVPGDLLDRRKLMSILTGVAGIIIISLSSQPWHAAGMREIFGMLLLILSEASSALGNIAFAKKKKTVLNPVATNAAQMATGGVALLLAALVVEGVPVIPHSLEFGMALLSLAFISAAAFSIWFYLLKKTPVSELNIWKFLIPVFGAVFSWMFLPDESPDLISVAGMLCIVISIVVLYKKEKMEYGRLPVE